LKKTTQDRGFEEDPDIIFSINPSKPLSVNKVPSSIVPLKKPMLLNPTLKVNKLYLTSIFR